jgi:hypothetical protein
MQAFLDAFKSHKSQLSFCIEGSNSCGCSSDDCKRLLCDDAFTLLRALAANVSRDVVKNNIMAPGTTSEKVVVYLCSDLGRKRASSLARKMYSNLPVERSPSDADLMEVVISHIANKQQDLLLVTDEYGSADDVSGLKSLLELKGYAPRVFQGSASEAYSSSVRASFFLGSTLCSTSSVALGARLLAGLSATTLQYTKTINNVFSAVGLGGLPWNSTDEGLAMTSIFGVEDHSGHPYVAASTAGAVVAISAAEAPFLAGLVPAPLPGHASYICNYPVSLHVGDSPSDEASTSRRACFPISFKDHLRLETSMVAFYKDGTCAHGSSRLCLSLFRTTCQQLQATRYIVASSTLNQLSRMCSVALAL